jgi:hypothetical protein
MPMLWFVIITGAVVWAVPRMLDAFLYYFDKRNTSLMQEIELEERRLEIMKQQYKLQQMQGNRTIK